MTDARILWPGADVPVRIWWEWLAGELFGNTTFETPLLMCLRDVKPFADATHPMKSVAAYDDTGILIWQGGELVFPMSSHAYQVNSKLSPDVDKDGRGDVGTIKPGRYIAQDLHTGKYPTFRVTMPDGDGHLPCWRDTNHDGLINHDEVMKAWTATEILIHGGIDDPPDSPHHFSIGCQCVQLLNRNIMVAHCAPSGLLHYLLVDADVAIATMKNNPYLLKENLPPPTSNA